MNEPYPWQRAQWAQCLQRLRDRTLPHALLLSGPLGLGKFDFARRLAQRLLCEQPKEAACGHCHSCRLFSAGTHPAYLEIATSEDARQLKVDQIRGIGHFLSLSSTSERPKIVLIKDADEMNQNAANSLLKTLEEPPPAALILLVTARSGLLPATVISRCQRLVFATPARAVAAAWLRSQAPDQDVESLLASAAGAPLQALNMSRDEAPDARCAVRKDLVSLARGEIAPVAVAARWQRHAPDALLTWLLAWLTELAKVRAFSRQMGPDIDPDLRTLSEQINSPRLFSLYDQLLKFRRGPSAALNQQLMFEDIALAWAEAFKHTP
jgi:DNA polymerase III subunit delta'